MTSNQGNKTFKVAITYDQTGGAVAVDGKIIGSHERPPKAKTTNLRNPIKPLNPSIFLGPKLKIKRAKKHLAELEAMLQTFHQSNPYEGVRDKDAKTGENVYRIRIHKPVPNCISTIAGDAVHNLRSALDQLVCELVLANRKQITRGTGFPISGTV